MDETVIAEDVARKFLLGELTPDEREEIEEQAFMDRESFLFLQASADDLIDESLTGDLTTAERERFETYFLSQPGRRVELRIGRALQRHVSNVEDSTRFGSDVVRPSFWEWLKFNRSLKLSLAAAALILAAVIGTWLAIYILRQNRPAPIEVQKQSTETPTPPNNGSKRPEQPANSPAPKEHQIKAPTRNQPSATIYSFLLVPGGPVRGENNVTTVPMPTPVAIGTATFRLPLIEDRFRRFQATLQRDDGKAVRKWTNLKASESNVGRVIQVSVPVGLLIRQQRYRFLLRGISEDGKPRDINSYYFQVTN